jgi:EAL domain-containing protein (putative c-di-GMP-specific phosphodiesterase class I)
MYVSKRDRKGLLTATDRVAPTRRGVNLINDLAVDLRTALLEEDLGLAYQPIVRTSDGLVVGAETLLRWTHPVRGQIPAPQTVAIAERAGLIDELGAWTIKRSCLDRAGWRPGSPDVIDLALNLSAVQLLNHRMPHTFEETLKDLGVDPVSVVLEITESILIQDGGRALVVLRALKRLGFRLALDDFGTGYSSLSHLHRFPIDILKIDRGFVERITFDHEAAVIVEAMTDLGHKLGMQIIAEGAETHRQVVRLREIGVDSAQGYYFARPMSGADMATLLESSPTTTILPAA